MFGYITIDKPEMKFREYGRYQADYCGLCHALGKRHGQAARCSVGYDMTFLSILLDGLYDSENKIRRFRCPVHPSGKRIMMSNEFLDYAADMSLYMAYLKCEDDWLDERKISRKLYASWILRRVRKLESVYPQKTGKIKEALARLNDMEMKGSQDFEAAAGCFGRVTEEIFAYREDVWEKQLRHIGFFIGKFIYIIDAHEDYYDDVRRGSYNPLKKLREDPEYDTKIEEILTMMIAEAADAFEQLPIEDNIDIIRNILYSGVWKNFRKEISDDRSL